MVMGPTKGSYRLSDQKRKGEACPLLCITVMSAHNSHALAPKHAPSSSGPPPPLLLFPVYRFSLSSPFFLEKFLIKLTYPITLS